MLMKDYQIIHGDCLTELDKIEENSIDFIFTSPPYEDLKNYRGLENKIGVEYLDWIIEVSRKIHKCLKPDASFVLNIGDKIAKNHTRTTLIPDIISHLVRDVNFNYIEDYIWYKKKALPVRSKYRATNIYEHCIWFSKGMDFTFNVDSIRRPYAKSSKRRFNLPVLDRWVREEDKNFIDYTNWQENPKGALPINLLDIEQPSEKTYDFANLLNILSTCLEDKKWLEDMNLSNEKIDIKDIPKLLHNLSMYSLSNDYAPNDVLSMLSNVYPTNVVSISSEYRNKYHCAVFPEELASWFIRAASNPGDIVLDPFAGSGTTLKVATDLQRKAIGIEINETYIEKIIERINKNHV